MSIALMTEVWRLDLPCTDKMVLLALADAANDDGVTWIAMRSQREGKSDLIKKCSLSERAIQMAVKRLCEDGYLSRLEKSGRGVIYTVTPARRAPPHDVPPAPDAPTPARRAPKPSTNLSDIISNEIISDAKPIKAEKKIPIPHDWSPTEENRTYAAEQGLTPEETDREATEFRDYFIDKQDRRPGWDLSWQRWCRKTADRKRERGQRLASRPAFGGGGGSGVTDFAAIAARRRGFVSPGG